MCSETGVCPAHAPIAYNVRMPRYFNKLLVIANPAAQNGAGRVAAARVRALLAAVMGEESFVLEYTEGPWHARELAAASASRGFDAVCALGGDGAAHEVANGLMDIPAALRPALALVPVGSGNDYARTIGMPGSLDAAVLRLADTKPALLDVGRCNGRWFLETLSFGLDAAIALDTVERRARTGKTGTVLYLQAGIDQLLHHMDLHRYTASFDGGRSEQGQSYLFAVQVGQTYGGGFRICPEACATDGVLDVCIAHPPLTRALAIGIFLLAKDAHHTRFKQLEFRRTRSLNISFDNPLAVQIDGEKLAATSFDVSVAHRALRVVAPAFSKAARS